MKFVSVNLLVCFLLGVVFISCSGSKVKYIEPGSLAKLANPCIVQKDTFTIDVDKKWSAVGRYTYNQEGAGVLYSFNAKDSSVIIKDLTKRKFTEYKVPYSLAEYDYFFYKDNIFYFLAADHWLKWHTGADIVKKQTIVSPKGFEFYYGGGYIQQPVYSPDGKYVLLCLRDTKNKYYLDSRNLDAYVSLETGTSFLFNMQFPDKYLRGKFLPTASYSREWLTDSTIVYSFPIDENLYVINVFTGEIQLFDGRSQYQTETIQPQKSKKPTKDEFAEFYQYSDYYPRMILNRQRGELYRIYKKRMPEKNEKGEFTTRADQDHSVVVFDLQLNKKCEIDMPVSERYVWRFVPSKSGFFYDMFIDPIRNEKQPYNKYMEIRFDD